MRFEYRILLLLSLVIVCGFTFINFLSLVYLRDLVEERVREEARIYSKLLLYNRTERLPEHIRISETPLPLRGYSLILYTGKHYIFVREDYVKSRLLGYALSLFFWEAVLVIMLLSLFYLTLVRNLRTERELTDLLNVMLLSLTHKLGNFIASQKINLQLLGESPPAQRLRLSLEDLERSYHKSFTLLETLRRDRNVRKERVDVVEVVRNAFSTLGEEDRKFRFDAPSGGLFVKANPVYVELLISLLLENAFKYSRSLVHVKLCRTREGKPLLLIRNDVRDRTGGSGIGLQIVKFIAEKLEADLRIRVRRSFTVLIVF